MCHELGVSPTTLALLIELKAVLSGAAIPARVNAAGSNSLARLIGEFVVVPRLDTGKVRVEREGVGIIRMT